jgi:peptidoglycan-associated lipoprotein
MNQRRTPAMRWALATVMAAALMAAGCASKVPLDNKSDVPVESRTGTTPGGGAGAGAGAGGTAQSQVATVDLSRNAEAPAARVVYFDYDSFAIRDEYRGLIDSTAKQLSAQRGKRLSIEGHTDERGGREYNLALGQKRAEAVAKALALLGVPEAQLEAVSFGKERPAVQGADEAAWAKNRRAELKDK